MWHHDSFQVMKKDSRGWAVQKSVDKLFNAQHMSINIQVMGETIKSEKLIIKLINGYKGMIISFLRKACNYYSFVLLRKVSSKNCTLLKSDVII